MFIPPDVYVIRSRGAHDTDDLSRRHPTHVVHRTEALLLRRYFDSVPTVSSPVPANLAVAIVARIASHPDCLCYLAGHVLFTTDQVAWEQ